MDLLTVVMHELAHQLSQPDVSAAFEAHDLMTDVLYTGLRRLPAAPPSIVNVMQLPLTLLGANAASNRPMAADANLPGMTMAAPVSSTGGLPTATSVRAADQVAAVLPNPASSKATLLAIFESANDFLDSEMRRTPFESLVQLDALFNALGE
jgi:hypothetical protein